jgi:tight adherence protein C
MDLMSLTRDAGASFRESLETAAKENGEHPAGEVLTDVLHLLDSGRTQQQAMNALADRVNEETVCELVFAINKADELGTPIARTLAELADQMRLKRQQWGEKVAGEAQVKIMFPGILIMLACIIVILAPMLLAALSELSL